jgi:hypothetical protein
MIDFGGILVGAILALLGSVWTTYITLNRESSLESQREARRTQRHEYLIWLMRELVEARGAYEEFLGRSSNFKDSELKDSQEAMADHARIIGKAIAACLATGDTELREIAEGDNGLTPYTVKDFKTRNRDKLHDALNRLGKLINEISDNEQISHK